MYRKIRIKPSRKISAKCFGLAFILFIAGATILPFLGLPGIILLALIVIFMIVCMYHVLSEKGASPWEFDIELDPGNDEDFELKLRKLESLRKDNLISEQEYETKRRDIMGGKW